MAAQPEGVPCWADAMFTDVEGAKAFYGDVLGWTFGEGSSEYGNYTQAYSDGTFGVWQAGKHEGFEKRGEPGAYAWAEVFTRAPEKSDAFFPAVFPYTVQRMEDDAIDFKVFNVGDDTVLGRMTMTDEFPPEIPPYIQVYFTVEDCDAAVSRATERGGELQSGPMDSPFGRFAALTDPQGAAFAVIDMRTAKGEAEDVGCLRHRTGGPPAAYRRP
ncbi:VOC family protein [Streptomyces flavidovirens]|uniref:VOC family protein n=1 Tax=Streptomyces flavidovirens TaxID=67298 RepID=UPI0036BBB010